MPRRATQILATLGLLAGVFAGYWFHVHSGVEWSVDTFQADVERLGAVGPALFVAAIALRPFLLLPSWIFLVAGGILFGTLWGTIWSTLGTFAGALWIYGMARALGRDAVERRLSGAVARVDGYMASTARSGWRPGAPCRLPRSRPPSPPRACRACGPPRSGWRRCWACCPAAPSTRSWPRRS